VRDTKRLMRAGSSTAIAAAIQAENAIFAARLHGLEAQEALQAFFDKRKPDFSRF